MTEQKAQVVYVDASGKKFQLDSKAKLKWACRRGMLELDVLFGPFVDEAYDALDQSQRYTFQRLLAGEDPELFAWFMGHEICPDDELRGMVELILNRVKVS
jgi:antitoxin CptB